MEGVLPFRRTPANILVRTMEYSPVGLLRGIKQTLVDIRSGKKTAAEALDTLSAGLVGTGLAALGLLLFQQGILTPPDDEDEKRQGFEELRGGQSYSLKIGDRYFSIDWLAPEALPLFIGAEIGNLKASEGGLVSALWDGITRITEPMLEMSMLSSLEDLLANLSYADTDRLWTILASSAIGYLTQGVPTLFGQIERTAEDRRVRLLWRRGERDPVRHPVRRLPDHEQAARRVPADPLHRRMGQGGDHRERPYQGAEQLPQSRIRLSGHLRTVRGRAAKAL